MHSKALVALLALSAGPLSHVAAQGLQCGDITDLESYCKTDCGDNTYKNSECGAFGPDCYCINPNGEVENTNVDAPIQCQGVNVGTTCSKECGKLQNIDNFSCKNGEIKFVCAKNDGIKGVGDDASQALLDYADAGDERAVQLAEELANRPAPAPVNIPDILNPAEGSGMSPPVDQAPPPTASGIQTGVGSFVLAAAFGLVLA